MANMRNKWEFYGSILEALGVDYTEAELKNNETLRAKLLEGLGVEHTYDDVNQYPLWREKLVEGVGNMSGGGGGSSDFITVTMSYTSDPDGLDIVVAKTTGLEKVTVLSTPQEFELVGSASALIMPYGMYDNVTGAEPYGDTEFLSVIDGATVVFS